MTAVSVVIPALDEAEHIVPVLEALQPLRAAGGEIIVADGGSTDATADVARPLADTVLSCAPGRARQMNAGAAMARGDWLWFLHADTVAGAPALAALRAAMARPGVQWGRFDVCLSGRHPLLRVVERAMNLRSRLTGICTGDQGIFVRRELFRALGGYADIPLMEDIELTRRLRRHGRPLCITAPLVTSSRRWERHGVMRTIVLMWRLRLAYALGASPHRLARLWRASG